MPLSAVGPILAAYRANYGSILAEIRQQLPNANLFVLNYFNPFPANPSSPAAPVFNAFGADLNDIIRGLAEQYGGAYIDTFTPFVGREADYTFLDEMPAGSSVPDPFSGTLPISNVHPNALGYRVIAAQIQAVPEPASIGMFATGGLIVIAAAWRRRGNRGGSIRRDD